MRVQFWTWLGRVWGVGVFCTAAACGQAQSQGGGSIGIDEAALVAAVAASESGNGAEENGALGAEPFWIKGCDPTRIVDQVVSRVDTDADGTLSDVELAAVTDELGGPRERLRLLIDLYDANDNGALESSELSTFESDLQARCEAREARLLARFDTNRDGTIDDAERRAALNGLVARVRGVLNRGNADSDAGVDPRGGGNGRGRRLGLGARRQAAEARFDRDNDGRLGASERSSFQGHLRGCVRGEQDLDPPADDPAEEPGDDEPNTTADAGAAAGD
jgi:hypothetical protein